MLIHDNTNEVYFERRFYVITLNCILADLFGLFVLDIEGKIWTDARTIAWKEREQKQLQKYLSIIKTK